MPTADLGDTSLYFKQRGEGPPVLGIMGFGLDQRYWAAQIPAVTRTHSFVTFDNRGVGRSTGAIPHTFDEMAHDAVRLLDHLGIEKTVVFGVSMGGAIAQRLVLDHPDRVSALILGITFARPIEFMRRQHDIARTLVGVVGSRGLLEMTLVRMFRPEFFEIGREEIDRMVRSFLVDGEQDIVTDDVIRAQLDALDKHDVLEDLASVRCPTLVYGARNDMMVPGFASEEIAAKIPGSELVMFEGGHGCMVEEMDAVNATIDRFLTALV